MTMQTDRSISLSFVVPCYNEAENIEDTLQSIVEAAEQTAIPYEIIVVDDKSGDRTLEIALSAASKNPKLRVVANPANLGLGGSYKAGVASAKNNYVMLIPGDNGFPPSSISRALSRVGSADIVIPYVTNTSSRGTLRTVLHYSFTALLNFLFWTDVKYYNGPVVHKIERLKTIVIATNGFAYQAEALVKLIASGATYTHIDITVRDRTAGASTALSKANRLSVYKTIYRLLSDVGLFRRIRFPRSKWAEELG